MTGRLRIVAGEARGRTLAVPKGRQVRPTPERVREALFSILGERCVEARVADVCAGTGALGLEALSRGAREVVLIERDRQVAETLRENVRRLGLTGARVELGEAQRVLRRLGSAGESFDLCFVDPPFRLELASSIAEGLVEEGLLAPGGLVVIEHPVAQALPELAGLRRIDSRRYGTVALAFFEGV